MVRFSDRPTVSEDVVVPAPADDVWDLVTDIDVPARYSDEFQGAEWLDNGPAVGSRFTGHNRSGTFEWSTTCTVIECRPGEAFSYAVEDPDDPVAVWGYRLEPAEAGTRVEMFATMGPGRSGVTWAIRQNPDQEEQIVDARLAAWRANMRRTLDGMAEMLSAPND